MRPERLEHLLPELLSPEAIREVLAGLGVGRKRRRGKLPPPLVVQLVVFMALCRKKSVSAALGRLVTVVGKPRSWGRGKAPHSTSVTQARDRLGWEPVRVFYRLGRDRAVKRHGFTDRWRGLLAMAADGVHFRAPDTVANERCFGKPSCAQGAASYPQVRGVLVVGVRSHVVYEATFGPYRKRTPDERVGETALAELLLERLPKNALLLFDRGYCHKAFLFKVSSARQLIVRAPRSLKPRRVRCLADNTDLVEIQRGTETLRLRRVSYTYTSWRKEKKRKGKRRSSKARKAKTRVKVVLLTTLLDPKAYPKQEIKALYRSRWEAELAFRELKSHMLGSHVAFRSKTPTRVLQEAFAQLIAYQCLRGLMASAAVKAGKKPLQISFTGALEILMVALLSGLKRNAILDWIARECHLPKRRRRHCPRVVRRRSSPYTRKRHAA